jgi:hypothetical protein
MVLDGAVASCVAMSCYFWGEGGGTWYCWQLLGEAASSEGAVAPKVRLLLFLMFDRIGSGVLVVEQDQLGTPSATAPNNRYPMLRLVGSLPL